MANIIIKKDGEGYLAEVEGQKYLFAFGYSEEEAKNELLNVVEMMLDYHLELVENERKLKQQLLGNKALNYAL